MTTKKDVNNINEIVIDDNNISKKPEEIANAFNKFFSNVASELKSSRQNVPYNNYNQGNNKRKTGSNKLLENSMFCNPISETEILNTIKCLKNSKSTDIYDINTEIIKLYANFIVSPLCHIFQCCIDQGVFPTILKNS